MSSFCNNQASTYESDVLERNGKRSHRLYAAARMKPTTVLIQHRLYKSIITTIILHFDTDHDNSII
jgi:hypothetical protein